MQKILLGLLIPSQELVSVLFSHVYKARISDPRALSATFHKIIEIAMGNNYIIFWSIFNLFGQRRVETISVVAS